MMQHQHQQHVQAQRVQQLGMPLPMATSFAPEPANAKQRPPGLPPTPPPVFAGQRPSPGDVCMEVDTAAALKAAHRRSRSDVPFGYFPPGSSGGQLPPPKVEAGWGHHGCGSGGEDDLFNAYLNLEGLDGLNSSDERHDDGDSRGSSMKTNGADSSENESEGCAADSRAGGIRLWGDAGSADRREGLKRTAAGEPAAAPMARHARSLSMDSLIGKLNFSAGAAANGVMPGPNRFSLEFGSAEFTPVEMKKIMADDKLAEMALADPKRVKRVLANRQSAARSKERKMRYIAELEQKVQILQTEATTLSAQLTLLQRDSAGIATQNNELKFRLQAMEQQAQLRDALNEALTTEVQRLKLATAELRDSCSSNNLAHQLQLNAQDQIFQLHQQQQQATQIPFYQLQQAQQNGAGKTEEP
ncbi:Transcription factor RF2b [Dichanthelium oligosanthes]|uniref:Transcription factor RF2b n=1 Tax=Dichanthelium oligosanthes TaxID=888268 RepID=A0A1E5WJQ9_9POAL|nr:Transcription factor RF2b [Dichanthelium oligosanthes]